MSSDSKESVLVRALKVRALDETDYEEVARIYRANDTWLGAPVSHEFVETNLALAKSEYLSNSDPNRLLLGIFRDDRLILSAGILFWTRMPFATFLRIVSDPREFEGKDLVSALSVMYDALLDELEKRRCTRFYVLSCSKHHKAMAQIGRLNRRLRDNYLMTVEEVIPANSQPRYDSTWSMMGSKVWSTNLTLRAGTALNHIRDINFEIVDPLALDPANAPPRGRKDPV